MTGIAVEVKLEGLEAVMEKVKDAQFIQGPVREFMEKAVRETQKQVQGFTPVDTGRLRQSIHSSIDGASIPLWGLVDTNVNYAPFVEYGTKPHFPPRAPLETWARAHGMNVYALVKAIGFRGTKGRHMFQRGLEAARGKIDGWLREAEAKILEAWNK